MYLKIGNTEIKYRSEESKFIVLSQIISSFSSYEVPKIISSSDELDIWFGKEFKEYEYLKELLQIKDLALYLYKPVEEESLTNRDTLKITKDLHYHPKYSINEFKEFEEVIPEDSYPEIVGLSEGVLEDLFTNELITYSFDLIFPQDSIPNGWFLVVPTSKSYSRRLLLYKDTVPSIPGNTYDDFKNVSTVQEVVSELEKVGYRSVKISNGKYLLLSSEIREVNYFYGGDGFVMTPSFRGNNNLISKKYSQNGVIEFISKTIGGAKDSIKNGSDIKIELIKLSDDGMFRVIISRYEYIEYYEGYFSTRFKEERLDSRISKESKLVYCNLLGEVSDLPERGRWSLLGGYEESYSKSGYFNSIKLIMSEDKGMLSDFLLIPDLGKFCSLNPDLDYYQELEELAEISKNGTQVLIENSDNGWKYKEVTEIPGNPEKGVVYVFPGRFMILDESGKLQETTDREIINTKGNNFVFNYTKDLENRLIYFYRGVSLRGGVRRPGYYNYLLGFLQDIYSLSSKSIYYETPKEEDIEELSKKKSNYLVYNNLQYFYEKYQNGENYSTSGWMRFILGKVSRELEKRRWELVSKTSFLEISNIINETISKIFNRFSMIRSLSVTSLNVDFINRKVSLTIDTSISDLPENNYTLDVTLNFNN